MRKNILLLILSLVLTLGLSQQTSMAQDGGQQTEQYKDGGIYEDEDGSLWRYRADIQDFEKLTDDEVRRFNAGEDVSDYSKSPATDNSHASGNDDRNSGVDKNNYVHLKGERSGSNLGVSKFQVTSQNQRYVECTPYVDTAYKMFDFAGVLSGTQVKEIERRARLFCDRTGADIAIVILASCNHPAFGNLNTTESFIRDFYDYNDFKRDGLRLCLDLQHSRNSVYDAGKLYEENFMQSRYQEYGQNMRPYFDRKQYYEEIMWFIEQAEADWLYECSFPIWKCSIFGLILALIIFFVHKSKYKLVFAGTTANNYKVADSFVLTANDTRFVRTFTTRTYSPRQKSSGGGGSSSGGGGGGGSF